MTIITIDEVRDHDGEMTLYYDFKEFRQEGVMVNVCEFTDENTTMYLHDINKIRIRLSTKWNGTVGFLIYFMKDDDLRTGMFSCSGSDSIGFDFDSNVFILKVTINLDLSNINTPSPEYETAAL